MGLNGWDGKTGDHLQVSICEKESEECGKGNFLTEGRKELPSLLPLARTNKQFLQYLKGEDYH